MPGLRAVLEELRLYPDLDAELARCRPPRHLSLGPSKRQLADGAHFNPEEVRRFLVFCRKLRHVKGKWAGLAFVPDLWQVLFVIAPVFGWRRADGNRLYLELYLEVPRKNGKSTLCAAIALYLLTSDSNLEAGRLFEPGAEVYSAATTTRQAKEVFRPAEAMARRSPSLSRRLGIVKDSALIYEATLSRYEVLSGVPSKGDEKMGLNVSGAVLDELHVYKGFELIEAIESGTVAREQPLIVIITTAGLDQDGTPYAEKRAYAMAVTEGEVPDPRTWAVIYTIGEEDLERWDTPEVWAKANPGFGVSVSAGYLEDAAKKAARSETKRLTYLRLHLNYRTGAVSRFIDITVWDRSGAEFVRWEEDELRGRTAYGGLDLASSTDLASAVLVVPAWEPDPEDEEHLLEYLDVVVRAWTPKDTVRDRQPRQRALLTEWLSKGMVTGCAGQVIDYDDIELDLFALADRFDVQRMHFDRWGSKQLLTHLRDGGLRVLEMGQGFASFSAPLKETERLILQGRLRHNGNPVLRHAAASLVVVQDPAGNVKPNRDKSTGWIDSFVALVMAVDGWMRSRGESVYEDRGMEAV